MRRITQASAALAVAATMTFAPNAVAQAPAAQAPTAQAGMTISLSAPNAVSAYERVDLWGHTSAPRGSLIRIWQRAQRATAWKLEGTTRVRAGGNFSYWEEVTDFDRYYKACVNGRCSAQRLVEVAVN